MAVQAADFIRTVQLFADNMAAGLDIQKELATFAKAELAEAIRTGAGSPRYRRFVNGHPGVAEEMVIPPGPILYEFEWLGDVLVFALNFLEARYPVTGPGRGGHYRESHKVFVDGSPWRGSDIPADAEVMIANTQPYTRKVQVGSNGFELGKGIYTDVRQAILRQFRGLVEAETIFADLTGPGLPYVLKTHGFTVYRNGRKRYPKDRAAGQSLTYPAVVFRRKELF